MADRADRINNDGSITPRIFAESLGEFDRNGEYRCCGIVNGEKCNAPLTLVISKKGNYFREKSSAEPHKKGCVYNNKAIDKLISRLDLSGSNLNMDDLFSSIANQHCLSSVSPSLSSPVVTGESSPSAKNTQILPIDYGNRSPRSLKELCILLSQKSPEDHYAGKKVGDIIMTLDNVAEYRRKNFSGQKLIVKCSRFKDYIKYKDIIPNDSVILRDAYPYNYDTNPILFILEDVPKKAKNIKKIKDIRDIIFSPSTKNGVFIWGEWKQYKSYENIYSCRINKNMLYAPGPDGY